MFHAEIAGAVLRECGYGEDVIHRVKNLNLKSHFPEDPNSRVLEDALCLVFLEFQFAGLARKTDDKKMINVLRKSWAKMTPAGRAEAMKLTHGGRRAGSAGAGAGGSLSVMPASSRSQ